MEDYAGKNDDEGPVSELGEGEELELPKLHASQEFIACSKPTLVIPEGKIIVDAYGFYKKLDPDEVCPDVPQVAAQNIVRRYTLANHNKISVQIINFGATITSILVPDREGNMADIALGFDDVVDYVCEKDLRLGSTIGRYAGLISDAEFKIGNKDFYLSSNQSTNHSHGGCLGFDSVLWDSYVRKDRIIMSYSSYPGEEGYPGQLMVQVSFRLTKENTLVVETQARASMPTPVCITHQPYFNLAGHAAGPEGLKDHCITINADKYVVLEEETGKPTGELQDVGGTYYDLRVPRPLGRGMEKAPGGRGYNLTYCLTKGAPKTSVTFAARLVHPENGRYLEVLTDHPGLYLNTCGHLPNPDLPPPKEESLLENFFISQGENQDDDGIDPELKKTMDKLEWPRPPSIIPDEHIILEEDECELVPDMDERCETPPPRDQDDEDPDHFPRDEIEGCPPEPDLSDEAESEHIEIEVEQWIPPKPIPGKSGALYRNDGAIVLMPMEYPDSVKHRRFPNPILYPGELYTRTVIYKFGIVPLRKTVSPSKLLEELLASQKMNGSNDEFADMEAKSGSQVSPTLE